MQTNLIGVEVITSLLKSEFTFETGDNDSDDFVKGIVIECGVIYQYTDY